MLLFICGLVGARAETMDFNQWGLLAIQDGGRRKPVDTFARETLLRLSGLANYVAGDGRSWSPNEFLLSALLETHDWKKEPLILVPYHPLAVELGLDPAKRRFSFEQLATAPRLNALAQEARELHKADKEVDRKLKEAENVVSRLELFSHVVDSSAFTIVPPAPGRGSQWSVPSETNDSYPPESYKSAIEHLSALSQAYIAKDDFNFNLNSSELRQVMRQLNPDAYPSDTPLKLEYFYNHLRPFDWALCLYAAALLALGVSAHSAGMKTLRTLGLGAAMFGVLFHAGGIALRCIIAGRPPVTNMFESVVWVSFGTMAFGWIFFSRYRALTYLLAALPASLLCLLLLRQLPAAMPEAIDPLVPVLRSNFWLSTHVLTITLSYAAFLLAMAFGHIVLYRYIRTPETAAGQVTLHFWLYRVIQLGVLLLAIGTILGGVWANYSWGRFWGWDPKETWALIALLCYIFVLHGRLAGWWDQFGLAVSSVVCFCAVMMTWYGVNFILGKGLHSYGFGLGGEKYVATFVGLDIAYVVLACVRYHRVRARASLPELGGAEPLLES